MLATCFFLDIKISLEWSTRIPRMSASREFDLPGVSVRLMAERFICLQIAVSGRGEKATDIRGLTYSHAGGRLCRAWWGRVAVARNGVCGASVPRLRGSGGPGAAVGFRARGGGWGVGWGAACLAGLGPGGGPGVGLGGTG
ncbi:hypothetical protein GCM10010215_58870 [Streptomyces virginiae]|uniref:Uncharacterized protein n=1 Tax=Streptomyces virginiae TaxID=1961 RepID=A0ABQ3NQB1_STRVG|nr:hypothetical protein GCM10010215_58870 [Streptomyces virginiae]GHI14929.1 hypothetical protein Scinn_43920 [Streptomyces virginiae]